MEKRRSIIVTVVVATGTVRVIIRVTVTTTTVRSAITVNIYDLPSNVGYLCSIMILLRNVAARFAFSYCIITVKKSVEPVEKSHSTGLSPA
jgi:hypothetical protein